MLQVEASKVNATGLPLESTSTWASGVTVTVTVPPGCAVSATSKASFAPPSTTASELLLMLTPLTSSSVLMMPIVCAATLGGL